MCTPSSCTPNVCTPNVRTAKTIFNIADLLLSYYYVKLVLHEYCCMSFQVWNVHLLRAIIVTYYYCLLPLNVIHALYVMQTQEWLNCADKQMTIVSINSYRIVYRIH